jgi:hypothetical protein
MIERMFGIAVERQVLPEDLDTLVPGPILAGFLFRIERSRLNGHDLVVVMRAEARMEAHYAAERMATITEVAYSPNGDADSGVERSEGLAEFAADDVGAALNLTRRTADAELGFALEIRELLPLVWEALSQGGIDVRRARTIVHGTSHLSEDTAREVVERIIETAPGLTTGQLAARIRRLCIQTDPEEARTRYDQALSDRRILIEATTDGTADLRAYGLPADRAAAISRKLNRLARNLKKHDGSRTMDQLRTDIFVDLLSGDHHSGGTDRGIVDIRVDLTTLAGLDEKPAEIPGYGPVIADIARQVAAKQQTSEWRYAATDCDSGQALHSGITCRRPTAALKRHVQTQHPTCVFPGCRMPSVDCDLDHRVAVIDGGATTPCNLAPLCRHHHRVKHQAPWKPTPTPDGGHTWLSRLGHTYTTSGQSP